MHSHTLMLSAAALGLLQFGPTLTGIPPVMGRLAPGACGSHCPGQLALTFDDGPHPDGTPAVLRVLADHACRATFFVVGEQVRRFPDLVRRAHDEGHEIAVHGWSHAPTPFIPPHRMVRELQQTADLIVDLTGQRPLRYRPPYGVASGGALLAARSAGLQPVWWTRWVREWDRTTTVADITARALAKPGRILTRGGTLLLHDADTYGRPGSWQLIQRALPQIIDGWMRLGVDLAP